MTKEEILTEFQDINQMYNNCTRLDTLSRMLDELWDTAYDEGYYIAGFDECCEDEKGDYDCL